MSSPRAGAHRARARTAPPGVRLTVMLLAVAGIASLVGWALHARTPLGEDPGRPAQAITQPTSRPTPTQGTPLGSPAPGSPTSTPGAPAPSTPTGAPSSSPPVPPSTTAPTAAAPRLPLLVLNNSRIDGLAGQAAADFRRGGWPVRGTGNFRGRIEATTVYYEPGQLASAQRLAREFPQVRRVLPRFAGLPGSGLTVVVTRDYRD